MNRIILALITLAVSVPCFGQRFDFERTWTDSTGKFSVPASLQGYDKQSVQLRKRDGDTISIPKARLSKDDRGYLTAVEAIRETQSQAELLAPHMSHAATKPGATVEIIDALRAEQPNAIGAHLVGGCVHAAIGKENTNVLQARRCLDDGIKILRLVDEHFPGLHRRTFTSVLNNRAVVAIRQGNVMSAISFLTQAAELMPESIPIAVYHNASLLLDSKLDLGAGRTKLARILARGRPEESEKIPNYLMYTLDHDPFFAAKSAADSEPKDLKMPPSAPAGKFLTGYGSGFLISPTLVLTNRHVVEDCDAFCIKNDSGLVVNAVADKVSGSKDIDLAILKLETPVESEPFPIRSDLPSIGESFVVLGYPIPQVFEASLTASRGIVSKLVENNLQILHDATTDPGNSGGPCVDKNGNVIGVHFAGSAISKNNRNFAVSSTAVTTFLHGLSDYQVVPTSNQAAEFSEIIAKHKDSVFMIECYSKRMPPRTASRPSTQTSTTPQTSILIPDRTCLLCAGKGHVDCPLCVNGFNSQSKTVKIGVNGVTGAPIYGPKAFKTKCTRCSRGGHVTCPICRGSGELR